MKKILIGILVIASVTSCRKAQITETRSIGDPCPWTDSSDHHPKDAALKALLEKYRQQRFTGYFIIDQRQ